MDQGSKWFEHEPYDDAAQGPVGLSASFRRFFLRGLAALLPTLLTLGIFLWAYNLLDHHVVRHVSRGLIGFMAVQSDGDLKVEHYQEHLLEYGTPVDEFDADLGQLTQEYKAFTSKNTTPKHKRELLLQIAFNRYHLGIVSFLIAILVVYFIGFFLTGFIGRTTWRLMEAGLMRIPLIKAIYPHVKQVTDFLLNERKVSFSGVVAVQYPREGIWTIGLMTGSGLKVLQESLGEELVSIFIPSSPTPVTGYVINVPAAEVKELPLSIDDALRFIITGGVVNPEPDRLAGWEPECGKALDGSEAAESLPTKVEH